MFSHDGSQGEANDGRGLNVLVNVSQGVVPSRGEISTNLQICKMQDRMKTTIWRGKCVVVRNITQQNLLREKYAFYPAKFNLTLQGN